MRKWLALAAVIVAVDQITKYVIFNKLALHASVYVTSFFNIVHVHNKGASFSMLANAGGWQRWFFIGIAVAASVWVVWLLLRHPHQKLFCLALTLILGGAIGNVIDRIWLGAVIDFLEFHYGGWSFPAFNVADSSITCGAILLILDGFRGEGNVPAESKT